MINENTIELIYSADQYVIAGDDNSEKFPVDGFHDNRRWRYPERNTQRVIFNQAKVEISFKVKEIDVNPFDIEEIPDGVFCVNDKYYVEINETHKTANGD